MDRLDNLFRFGRKSNGSTLDDVTWLIHYFLLVHRRIDEIYMLCLLGLLNCIRICLAVWATSQTENLIVRGP